MTIHTESRGDYTISTDKQLLQLDLIHEYLSNQSYWAQHIPQETLKRSIHHSLCFGIYQQAQQVGFARVVTDQATFAYLADVFILEPHRGKGLSIWVLNFIQACPELQGLRRWMLGTRDAHGLYEKMGWTRLDESTCQRFMQRHDPNIYSSGLDTQ